MSELYDSLVVEPVDEDFGVWPLGSEATMPAVLLGDGLMRALQQQFVPQLVRSLQRGETMPVLDEDVNALTRCLIGGDRRHARTILRDLRGRGVSSEAICHELFGPVARQLGSLWEDDECDFSTVTMSLIALEGMLNELPLDCDANAPEAVRPGRRMLLSAVPGEQHVFGVKMAAKFFRAAGWDAVVCPAATLAELVARVRAERFDIVGLSIGGERHLGTLSDTIVALRRASQNPHIRVLVGGPLAFINPTLGERSGADIVVTDEKDAVKAAARQVALN